MGEKPVIGFIGLGFMGHGMAKNILKGGYELWIRGHRNRQPIENLVAMGAHEGSSPAELARKCDVIHICLSNSAQVEAVINGNDGIASAARKGLIVIDTTTADPVSTMKLADELKAKGVTFVDAPLGRTPKEAEEGTLDAMVGCDEDVLDRIRPVLECWSGSITRVGPVGSGHKMKLLMNFLSLGYGALYAEALVLGAKVGIAPHTIRDVIAPSRMGNGFFDTFMRYNVDRDREAHKFSINNASKDIRYVNNMANDAGLMNVMASSVMSYYAHVMATGHGTDYVPMLTDHVGRLNGIDMEEVVAKSKG